MTEWRESDSWLEIGSEAEAYIIEALDERFGVSPFFLINLTRDPATWAAVLFTDIINDSDEVLRARGDLRGEIGFAAYGPAELGMPNPPLGAMSVKSATALKMASSRHEVFAKAWAALKECAPDRNWIALVEL
jgi:hypothetical protein